MYLHHEHASRVGHTRSSHAAALLTREGAGPVVAARLGASPERLFVETLGRIHPAWRTPDAS